MSTSQMKGISPPWILRRYVALEYVRWFIFCVCAFDGIAIVVDLFEKAGTFLSKHATASQVFRYTMFQLPEFVTYMIAPSLLIAMLVAISGMARRNEITAILAGGIGRRTIVAPMALIALLMSAAQFSISEYIVPEANAQKDYILDVEVNGKNAKFSDRRNHWFFTDGGFLRVAVFDRVPRENGPDDIELHGVMYLKGGEAGRQPVRIEAQAAHWNDADKTWVLDDERRALVDSSGLLRVMHSDHGVLSLTLTPADLSGKMAHAEEYGVAELEKIIHDREKLGQSVIKEMTDLQSRFALPLAGFVMGLLGAPFAFREHRRGGAITGIIIGIVIAFSYFLVEATSLSFGKSGAIPPLIAAWLPNVLFGGAGIYLSATLDVM
ncbi:MAG TPA: LptF/LptG family permease [bacterium]|nr:LptF/LptG family permease [bacterium]